jgi:RNA polymerase sigma-70 factor (ECF subfamily)
MPTDSSFPDLMGRVRAGDDAAAAELVRRFEPVIRRTVRIRLRDPRLRRVLDSLDVCQSVLASFFTRAALGQFDLDSPDHLVRLLATMARNKLANQANHHAAQCRDPARLEAEGVADRDIAAAGPSPSEQVGLRDLLEQVRQRLGEDERVVVEERAAGRGWAELAAERGTSPEALRKKLDRAIDRATRDLGLDDLAHE